MSLRSRIEAQQRTTVPVKRAPVVSQWVRRAQANALPAKEYGR